MPLWALGQAGIEPTSFHTSRMLYLAELLSQMARAGEWRAAFHGLAAFLWSCPMRDWRNKPESN